MRIAVLAQMSSRDQRALVIGVTSILALVALGRGLPAWRQWRSESQLSAAQLTAEATRAEDAIRDASAVGDSLRSRNARFLALAPALIDGATRAAAAASLSGIVSTAAAGASMRVISMELQQRDAGADSSSPARMPTTTASRSRRAFARIALRAELVGDVHGLTTFLASLEGGPTRIAVRELGVNQPNPGAGADRAEVLRVQLLVEALALDRSAASSSSDRQRRNR